MKRLTVTMGGLLGAQLILALLLSAFSPDHSSFKAKEPLLAFDAAKVDGIEIGESGANSVKLAKQDGKWIVPSLAGFPADGAKVSGLLTKLAALKKGWPVGTTAEARKRFKVTDDVYERRIVLKSAGKAMAALLLGSSPAFKQVHARDANGGNVYSVAFANYDAGTRGEDWMDRGAIDIPQDRIASISIGGVTLERKDQGFVIPALAEGEKLNETAVWSLVGAVSHPAFDAVEGKGAEALAKVSTPDIEVTIKRTGGATDVLKFKKEAVGGAYLFTGSGSDFLFRVAEASIEPIVKAKREALVQEPSKAKTEGVQAETKHEEPQAPKSGG